MRVTLSHRDDGFVNVEVLESGDKRRWFAVPNLWGIEYLIDRADEIVVLDKEAPEVPGRARRFFPPYTQEMVDQIKHLLES